MSSHLWHYAYIRQIDGSLVGFQRLWWPVQQLECNTTLINSHFLTTASMKPPALPIRLTFFMSIFFSLTISHLRIPINKQFILAKTWKNTLENQAILCLKGSRVSVHFQSILHVIMFIFFITCTSKKCFVHTEILSMIKKGF